RPDPCVQGQIGEEIIADDRGSGALIGNADGTQHHLLSTIEILEEGVRAAWVIRLVRLPTEHHVQRIGELGGYLRTDVKVGANAAWPLDGHVRILVKRQAPGAQRAGGWQNRYLSGPRGTIRKLRPEQVGVRALFVNLVAEISGAAAVAIALNVEPDQVRFV